MDNLINNSNDLYENQFDLVNIQKWDKLRYFSFKNRKRYPNLFFYYFNPKGKIKREFTKTEKEKVYSTICQNPKLFNGLWGYISLNFNEKNGIEIYKFFSKLPILSSCNSMPCIQDGKPYSEEIKVKFYFN